jgi:flagellar basal-body rod protein FlgB
MTILPKVLTLYKGIGVKPWLKSVEGETPMFENIDIFRMSTAMARHAGKQQAVVAQNVANSDTPGYAMREMPDFKTSYLPAGDSGAQRATRVQHLHGTMDGAGLPAAHEVRARSSRNGNQISLETEILKSVDAKRQHERAMAIYKTSIGVLRSSMRTT